VIRDDIFYLAIKFYVRKEKEWMGAHPESTRRCWMTYRQERLRRVATYCIAHWPGDLVEIGAWEGHTTAMLADLARGNGRRVIAVDPWIPGQQNCEEETYARFLERTAPYKDIIDEVHLGSEDPKAIAYVKARELCFAYVDGMHCHEYALRDIQTVAHCNGIIVVDDVDKLTYAGSAFWEGATLLRREVLYFPNFIEGYLLPMEIP